MDLGETYRPPFVGIRSPYNEFAPACDDKGNTYTAVGPERIGTSAFLYMKFVPAPPLDAKLTITLDRIFVSTDRTWRGSLYCPSRGSPEGRSPTRTAASLHAAGCSEEAGGRSRSARGRAL